MSAPGSVMCIRPFRWPPGEPMRLPIRLLRRGLALALAALAPSGAIAQTAPPKTLGSGLGMAQGGGGAGGDTATPLQGAADPDVGRVEGHVIYLSERGEEAKTRPDNLRALPFDTLYPVLLDRMIDHQALVIMARRK